MLLLTSTSDLVRVTTGSAADLEVHASWIDNVSGVLTPGRTNTASITTATTTTIVAAPASSTQRNVVGLNMRNNHASQETAVSVLHTDGTNIETLISCTLLPGEVLVLAKIGEWYHYDNNAAVYLETGRFATQAEIEAESSSSIMCSVGLIGKSPSIAKFWTKANAAGSSLAGFNITSITDGGTGLATVNIGTDFSGADWSCGVTVERAATALTVANLRYGRIRNAQQAAGSVQIECYDGTAGTALLADPTAFHVVGFGDQ